MVHIRFAVALVWSLSFILGRHVTAAETAPHRAPDLFPVTHHAAPVHDPVVLVKDGEAVATICILDVPEVKGRTQAFRHALRELQDTIELATGVRLPVVHGEIHEPAIILGNGPAAEAVGLRGADLPPEGFVIRTAPGRVYIVGHDDPRAEMAALPGATPQPLEGTAWGVFEFLERFVGVRWYWANATWHSLAPYERRFTTDPAHVRMQPGGCHVPRLETLAVPPSHLSDHPVFAMRGGEHPWPAHLQPLHAAQRLANTHQNSIAVHQPHGWGAIPEIVDNHPAVMELRADGSRCDRMLCYSNPMTLEVYLREIARVLDDGEPVDARRMGIRGNAISVSPWDRFPDCHCEDCPPRVGRHISQGQYSRIIGDFTRRLAVEVQKRWPDKTVMYLPYQNYTTAPEGIEFPDNVEAQICGMGGIAWLRPGTPPGEWYQKTLERWTSLTGRKVQTWEYSMYPAHRTQAAYQFPYILQRFYQRNRDLLVGSFLNAAIDHRTKRHVTAYVWARLLWNPDIDVTATLDEYARRMYGDAAAQVREILQIQIDGWENFGVQNPNAWFRPEDLYFDPDGYTVERMERIRELLGVARRRVSHDAVTARRLDFFAEPFEVFFKEYERIVHGHGARALHVRQVATLPPPDAALDDPAWKKTTPALLRTRGQDSTVYANRDGTPFGEGDAVFPTQVRALWTPDTLAIGIRACEPQPDAVYTHQGPDPEDTPGRRLFEQDAVEIVLNPTGPGGDPTALTHLIVNAASEVWIAHHEDAFVPTSDVTVATGTDDCGWRLDIRIPLSILREHHADALDLEADVAWYGQVTRLRSSSRKQDGIREQQKLNAYYHAAIYDTRNKADFAPIRFQR